MTVKATITAALPEARRMSNFLERDYAEEGAVVSFFEQSEGLWEIEAYFAAGEADVIHAMIRDRLGTDAFGAPLQVRDLPETDWIAEGLKTLTPVSAGRFLVHGSHARGNLPGGRIRIEIDAGQAFGTGHHASTAGILTILDGLVSRYAFRRILDLGTGSGVLAIALAKALRQPVLATDIDPVSVAVASENARRNGVGHTVRTITAAGVAHPVIRSRAPFDLVVANILAEPLRRLAPDVVPLLAPGGMLVLAGILTTQSSRVIAAYRAQGARLVRARNREGWTTLVLRRP
jgi:ribosomal protein L11 methyltransferase